MWIAARKCVERVIFGQGTQKRGYSLALRFETLRVDNFDTASVFLYWYSEFCAKSVEISDLCVCENYVADVEVILTVIIKRINENQGLKMLKCFLCEKSGTSVKKFNEEKLEKCHKIQAFRKKKNLKHADVALPVPSLPRRGYHILCYEKFIMLKSNNIKKEFDDKVTILLLIINLLLFIVN